MARAPYDLGVQQALTKISFPSPKRFAVCRWGALTIAGLGHGFFNWSCALVRPEGSLVDGGTDGTPANGRLRHVSLKKVAVGYVPAGGVQSDSNYPSGSSAPQPVTTQPAAAEEQFQFWSPRTQAWTSGIETLGEVSGPAVGDGVSAEFGEMQYLGGSTRPDQTKASTAYASQEAADGTPLGAEIQDDPFPRWVYFDDGGPFTGDEIPDYRVAYKKTRAVSGPAHPTNLHPPDAATSFKFPDATTFEAVATGIPFNVSTFVCYQTAEASHPLALGGQAASYDEDALWPQGADFPQASEAARKNAYLISSEAAVLHTATLDFAGKTTTLVVNGAPVSFTCVAVVQDAEPSGVMTLGAGLWLLWERTDLIGTPLDPADYPAPP